MSWFGFGGQDEGAAALSPCDQLISRVRNSEGVEERLEVSDTMRYVMTRWQISNCVAWSSLQVTHDTRRQY